YTKKVWPIAARWRMTTRRDLLRVSSTRRGGQRGGRPSAIDELVVAPLEGHGDLGANREGAVVTALRPRLEPESLGGVVDARLVRLGTHHAHLVIDHAGTDPVEGGGDGVPLPAPVAASLLRTPAQELSRIRLDALGAEQLEGKSAEDATVHRVRPRPP